MSHTKHPPEPDNSAGQEDDESVLPILPKPPEPPLEVFPTPVQQMLVNAGEAFSVPLGIVVASFLGFMSVLIGQSVEVEAKSGWLEAANLWIVIVMVSGGGKSPLLDAFMKPIRALEYKAYQRHKADMKKYKIDLAAHTGALEQFKKGKIEESEIPPKPEMPICEQLTADDVTMQALHTIHAGNPRGVGLVRDELDGLFKSFNRFSKGKGDDNQRFISGHNRAPWRNNRVDQDRDGYIPKACLSVLGGIQPGILIKAFKGGDGGEDLESGLLPRFIFIRGEMDKPAVSNSIEFSGGPLLRQVTEHLWELKAQFQDETGELLAAKVQLTPDARLEYNRWYDSIAYEAFREPGKASMLRKLQAHALRLAVILHCLDAALEGVGQHEMDAIPLDTVQRAIKLADWVKIHQDHVWRLFDPGAPLSSIPPIDKVIMECCVEHEADIMKGKAGGKVTNATLLALVQAKPHMKNLKSESLGSAAKRLGMKKLEGTDRKHGRGYRVTADDLKRFKAMLQAARGSEQPHSPTDASSRVTGEL